MSSANDREPCPTRKRSRRELESILDEGSSTNTHVCPPQKKLKLDPYEVISKFITNSVKPSQMINSINAIGDLTKQGLISAELMNSLFLISPANTKWDNHKLLRTLLAQIIYNIGILEGYTKPNVQLLQSLKKLLILILNNGADPMLKQTNKVYTYTHYYTAIATYRTNTSAPTSTNIFHQLSSHFFKDIKFDLYLFTHSTDLQISILNIAKSYPYPSWYKSIQTTGYYFADHIQQGMITKEFTFDIGIKALCWFPLILVFNRKTSYTAYDYQDIISGPGMIPDRYTISDVINSKLKLARHIGIPVWLLHLFILKEYYKIYPIQFEQCLLDEIPKDIINVLKDYCIPTYDYYRLDVDIDEELWIVQCLHNIYRLGDDWKRIFYRIMIRNEKYVDCLLDFSLSNQYKDIYSSIYELIWDDEDIVEKISDEPAKLVHFIARCMEYGHKEFLSKLLVKIGEKYEFDFNSFIVSESDDNINWCNILNFCIMEYGNDKVSKSMFNEICDCIVKYCLNDSNIIFNVMDKLWTKREWINKTKWTKYRLECLKILKNKLDLNLDKLLKYCYLRQNGKHKISSIKLVEMILKYKKERNILFDYNNCKQKNYLRNIENIVNYDKPLSNQMIKTVQQLITSFKQWKNEN